MSITKAAGVVLAAAMVWVGADGAMGKDNVTKSKEPGKMSIEVEPFGKMPDGREVRIVTMTGGNGLRAKITNYGGILVSMETPDRQGRPDDIVLGFDNLDDYLRPHPYFGAIIGRYANRIGGAKFTLDGAEYTLTKNEGDNTLHGGQKGFDKVLWKIEETRAEDDRAILKLGYTSRDGEEGFPGNLKCVVTYTLTADNKLKIKYEATTDKPTVVNLTSHAYWNLAGQSSEDILGHKLMINADGYTAVDGAKIPTGEIKSVKGTPLDFTEPTTIGSRIEQLEAGYDHNYVLRGRAGQMKLAARVYEPTSGRVMEIETTEPGIQFYSSYWLDGTLKGKQGRIYNRYAALCLETQHYPDSPNHDNFPSTVLRPGEKFESTTVHTFLSR